jgi:hypothetical protein
MAPNDWHITVTNPWARSWPLGREGKRGVGQIGSPALHLIASPDPGFDRLSCIHGIVLLVVFPCLAGQPILRIHSSYHFPSFHPQPDCRSAICDKPFSSGADQGRFTPASLTETCRWSPSTIFTLSRPLLGTPAPHSLWNSESAI